MYYTNTYIYIYIYRERESERERVRGRERGPQLRHGRRGGPAGRGQRRQLLQIVEHVARRARPRGREEAQVDVQGLDRPPGAVDEVGLVRHVPQELLGDLQEATAAAAVQLGGRRGPLRRASARLRMAVLEEERLTCTCMYVLCIYIYIYTYTYVYVFI